MTTVTTPRPLRPRADWPARKCEVCDALPQGYCDSDPVRCQGPYWAPTFAEPVQLHPKAVAPKARPLLPRLGDWLDSRSPGEMMVFAVAVLGVLLAVAWTAGWR